MRILVKGVADIGQCRSKEGNAQLTIKYWMVCTYYKCVYL